MKNISKYIKTKSTIGTLYRPRLSIFLSNKHLYAQLIDDINSKTLVFTSTLDKNIKFILNENTPEKSAYILGEHVTKLANKKNIFFVILDKNYRSYKGRIKNFIEGAKSLIINIKKNK